MSHAALKLTDRLTADERDSATRRESEDRVRYCILAVRQLAPGHSVAQALTRQEPALRMGAALQHAGPGGFTRLAAFRRTAALGARTGSTVSGTPACLVLTRLFYSTATLWHYCMVRGITGPWLEGLVPQNSVNMGLMASRTSSWGKWFTA